MSWMPELPEHRSWTHFVGPVLDRGLLPGAEVTLLELDGAPWDDAFTSIRDKVRGCLSELTVVIDYTDGYGTAFKPYQRNSRGLDVGCRLVTRRRFTRRGTWVLTRRGTWVLTRRGTRVLTRRGTRDLDRGATMTPRGGGNPETGDDAEWVMPTRHTMLGSRIVVERPAFIPKGRRGTEHIGPEDTFDDDYGRLLEAM